VHKVTKLTCPELGRIKQVQSYPDGARSAASKLPIEEVSTAHFPSKWPQAVEHVRHVQENSSIESATAQGVGFTLPAQRVLTGILVKLKAAADQDLNTNITKVIASASWLPAWEHHDVFRSDLNNALLRAGMSNWLGLSEPLYMTEVQATLAANRRCLCPPYEPYTEPMEFTEDYRPRAPDGVFFIR
jgi:hypothetical protein